MSAMSAQDLLAAQRCACRHALAAAYWAAAAASTGAAARLATAMGLPPLAIYWRGEALSAGHDARAYAEIAGTAGCPRRTVAALCGGVAGALAATGIALVAEWCWRLLASVIWAALGGERGGRR